MEPHLALAAAMLAEFGGLFALWDWSRLRSKKPLLIGSLGLATFAFLLCLGAPVLTARVAAGFFGMYIFSALLWAWWRDGRHPTHWRLRELVIAALAVGLFSVAASAA